MMSFQVLLKRQHLHDSAYVSKEWENLRICSYPRPADRNFSRFLSVLFANTINGIENEMSVETSKCVYVSYQMKQISIIFTHLVSQDQNTE